MEIEFEIVFGEKYWNDLLRTQCIYVRLKSLISLITTLFVLSIINHRQSITHLSSWDYQLSNIHQISNPSNIARDHFRNHVTLHSTIPSKIIFFKPLFIQRAEHMSILARDKVPPKTVKANINIPHCRGIPTKLPNQSHSRVVSKRLCKQKGEERRRGGREKSKRKRKEDGRSGGTEGKKRGGKCPSTEQRSAASSTVQGESSAKRGKGTKKELPRVGKQAPGFVCPRIFYRIFPPCIRNESTCICTGRGVETYE